MPEYLSDCPRCRAPVMPGLGLCERCQATFDPWVERPTVVGGLLAGSADELERGLDFPTVARHLTEVNRLVDRHETSVQDLVAVIVRDLALTTRLLRLVNGPAYRQYNEPVATVTRAVILVGFEQVRRVALSLILYQRLRDHPRGGPLADEAVLSFGAGLLARALLHAEDDTLGDEAFICAMYHRLGQLCLEAFLPVESEEIAALGLLPHESREDLELKVMDCTATQLGGAVARAFGLPHSIIWALRPPPPGHIAPPRNRTARLQLAAAFANELLHAAAAPGGDYAAVTNRYREALALDDVRVRALLVLVAGQLRHHAVDLGLGTDENARVKQVLALAGPGGLDDEAEGSLGNSTPSDSREKRLEDARRRAFLAQGRAELEAALRQGMPVPAMLSLAVEAIHRGFGFAHTALCLREVSQRGSAGPGASGERGPSEGSPQPHMVARVAFGPDAHKLRMKMRFPIERGTDVFTRAIFEGLDVVIDNVSQASGRGHRLPTWYSRQIVARGFVLFPVRIQGHTVALLYGDADDPAKCFQRNRFLFLREMREIIEASLERHRRTLPG